MNGGFLGRLQSNLREFFRPRAEQAVNTLGDFMKRAMPKKTVEFEGPEMMHRRLSEQNQQQQPTPQPGPTRQPSPTPTPSVSVEDLMAQQPATASADPFGDFGFVTESATPGAQLSPLILEAARANRIDPNLLAGLLWQESSFNPLATNAGVTAGGTPFTARGLGQFVDIYNPTITPEMAFDPEFAIPTVAEMLRDRINTYTTEGLSNPLSRAIASWFVGPSGARIQGSEAFGGGPQGQEYINNVARELSPDLIDRLGLITTLNR